MTVFSKSAAFAITALLAVAADAHMIMRTPVPYGKSTLNNSPLDGGGADFPCKQRPGVYDAEGASNVAAIGEPQTLSFIGGATHGGGSCQVALSTDLQPTKQSKWMVIKSIIGGCPDAFPGNLNGDASSTESATFQYTIPEGIAPGDYTIAWTWFNHIGNREMYMNCGPMTVTAAKKKRYAPAPKVSKRQASFPDIYVANIDNKQCQTPENVDLIFPNPGAYVQTAGSGPYVTATCDLGNNANNAEQPTASVPAVSGIATSAAVPTDAPASAPTSAPGFAYGSSGQLPQATGGGNDGKYSAGSPTAGSFASGAVSVPSPAPAPSSSADGLQVIPTSVAAGLAATPAVPVSPSQTVTVPRYTNTSAPQIAPGNVAAPTGTASVSTGSSSGVSAGAAGQLTGPCSNEGDWNCIDGSSFQRCASGSWSATIPLSGMKCTPGETGNNNFAMTPAKAKRFEA
ncbi:hypothetical protein G647_03917 [Cladophialophora carrionii CBS 160.54]|uniref:Lytic polysaccharide monooxygenase n=1 Tax=Cladophialophora carrionii CBS 160.54 TaxID=1279043 RepID=V9DDZ3_9EURO|nr:uncharacterized protein G647_03917 [Cladophialophora carrionii CBS 160.54]ETI24548.1 hypothetical protein G647_03917 [Cladophialophora carrionii CBS 160.54]